MGELASIEDLATRREQKRRADLERRNVVFAQRLAMSHPKDAVKLGPRFYEYIGLRQKSAAPEAPRAPKLDATTLYRVIDVYAPHHHRPGDAIIKHMAFKHGLPVSAIYGKGRSKPVVIARHEAMYRMRSQLGYSFPLIGKILGGRDHATVLNGVQKHADAHSLPYLSEAAKGRSRP